MRASATITVGLTAALLCAGSTIPAQNTAPAGAAKKSEPDEAHGTADVMRIYLVKGKEFTLMKGHVRFVHGDTTIASDEITFDRSANVAVSPGKITIVDPESDIAGDKGSMQFGKKLGIIEGNVIIQVKPRKGEEAEADEESAKSTLSQPTTITCPRVEYQYRAKVVTATGGVVFKQPRRTASADKAVYERNKEILTLTGNVKGADADGQTFSAPGKVVISLKKGDEWLQAENASATFKINAEEEGEQ